MPDGEITLLDYAIAEGKTLYFLEETMPGVDDTLRLRYTGEQLDWMRENTANVWGWLLQQKLKQRRIRRLLNPVHRNLLRR